MPLTSTRPAISATRLLHNLDRLAGFGGRPDGGVDRVAGSPADRASRQWLADCLQAHGLIARIDETGNVFGRATKADGPLLLVGSHTDTVPAGGRLDGAYGVIAALEVLLTLHEQGHDAGRRVGIVSFADEEGAAPDSTGGLTGSTALCGSKYLADFAAYLELHIEQGPRMEAAGYELCVVEGIVGVQRHRIRFTGETNHAGTTPFERRRDAGYAMVRAATAIQQVLRQQGAGMVGNIGWLSLQPGAPNVVPGVAELVVELRATTDQALAACRDQLLAACLAIGAEHGCRLEHAMLSEKPLTHFDPDLQAMLTKLCVASGVAHGSLFSFAGHDASVLSGHLPAAMLFVPSTGGISHAPSEHTEERLLVQGAQLLLDAVIAFHDSH